MQEPSPGSAPPAKAPFGFAEVDAADKPGLVRGVFEAVASRYDLMNDLMSGGVHRLWKDAAAARLNPQPGERIIDCAGGTGDMASRIARMAGAVHRRRGGAPAEVLVVEASEAMLRKGKARLGQEEILWAGGDAQALPLPDRSAHAYCIAFGLRNLTSLEAALAEARRVLKPGGRFISLEFSRPVSAALRKAYDAYSFRVIPRLGALAGKNEAAYRYLVESIRRFPDQEELSDRLRQAGFSQVSATNLSGGIVALHQGWAI
ncbi:MAG: class I SAM-dependent methyltransferase [Caulobacteraceae bacterium]